MDDTIVAISTPLGVGGISIIRLSGDEAIKIANGVFRGTNLLNVKSHTIHYGKIIFNNEIIDECLITIMRAPKTYTREDVVEINIHGGLATTNKVLEILLECGARLAESGEFTKRAFLNGRIDLVEAEAISEVINAENESARKLSINQLSGKLSSIIRDLRSKLLELEAQLEVNIDYPEYEDIEDVTLAKMKDTLIPLKQDFERLIEESKTGKLIQNGINIALIGRPNVGKSSILNALLEEEKAIVTDIAGTTRDIVEGRMTLNGIMINFIDTAGIRETDNYVEKIGVLRSLKKLDEADLIVLVLNNNEYLTKEDKELLDMIKDKNYLIFVNKNDLEKKLVFDKHNIIYGNTISLNGLDGLKDAISKVFELGTINQSDFTYISNARQLSLIKLAYNSICSSIQSIEQNVPVDIIGIDIREAREKLGEVLGESYKEELIDELFSKFCLGK